MTWLNKDQERKRAILFLFDHAKVNCTTAALKSRLTNVFNILMHIHFKAIKNCGGIKGMNTILEANIHKSDRLRWSNWHFVAQNSA